MKFRQLIEKQNTPVRHRNFARPERLPAAGESACRNRVVRASERPCLDQRVLRVQHAEDRIDLRDLNGLFLRHVGENRRNSFGEHALARARRANHQHIVSARRRNLERPLHVFLPLHIAKIRQRRRTCLRDPRLFGFDWGRTLKVRNERRDALHAIDCKPARKRRLCRVFLRNIKRLHAEPLCRQRHRKHACHRPELAL